MAAFQSSAWIGLLLIVASVGATVAHLSGYKVMRIIPHTEKAVHDLATFLHADKTFDIWRKSRLPGEATDVMVRGELAPELRRAFHGTEYNLEVMIDDVQALLENKTVGRINEQDGGRFNWLQYHTIESIHQWLREKALLYAGIATLISAGKTSEGREMLGLRIAHKANLPIVFIEAGIHAREWVSVATATWFIRAALSGDSDIIKSYEWHIFPSVNPDGYAYTQQDRLWRKSRRLVRENSDSCRGVDLNRNWAFQWKSGDDPCEDVYPGDKGESEPETQGLASYLTFVADRTKVYISLHSYSQLLMYPWAYTTELPPNAKRLDEVAQKATKKLSTSFGTQYRYGPIATTIYEAFGSTVDYAANLKIPYPFAFELRDTGTHGFLLPPPYIVATASETLDALTVILQEALQ